MNIEWSRVIEQAIGVLLGGGITITAIWVKELFDRRAGAQSWFEQTYITDGIDEILSYLKIVEIHLTTLKNLSAVVKQEGSVHPIVERAYAAEAIPPFPFDPLIRLGLLLRSDDIVVAVEDFRGLVGAYSSVRSDMRPLLGLEEEVRRLNQVIPQFVALREELLNARVKRRSEIHKVCSNANTQEVVSRVSALSEMWEREDQRYLAAPRLNSSSSN